MLAPLPKFRVLIVSFDPAAFPINASVPPLRVSVPCEDPKPSRLSTFVAEFSSVIVPPVLTLYVTGVICVDGKDAPKPLYVSPPPFTVTPPLEPAVALWALVIVSVPVPILTSVSAFPGTLLIVASLKRLICPENVVLVLSKPTVSVGVFNVVLVTMPEPASDPSTVL